MKKRFNFFWIIFGIVAVWELFPQYIMPILVGVSFICLTQRNSLVVSNIFGGAAGNEGLGLLVRDSLIPLLLTQERSLIDGLISSHCASTGNMLAHHASTYHSKP